MAEEGGRRACGGNLIGAVTRTPVGVLGGGPAHRMRAGHAPSPAARSPMRREDATRSPKQPRLRWGLGPRRPRAAGSPVRSPVRGSRPPATHAGGRSPVCSGRAGGLGTHVQLHQGEQVLLGGSEDGICLPAGDGLGSIALRVVADHRGRLCDGHALLGLERNTGGVTGGTGGGRGDSSAGRGRRCAPCQARCSPGARLRAGGPWSGRRPPWGLSWHPLCPLQGRQEG